MLGPFCSEDKKGRWEDTFQRELITSSCEKSRCVGLAQSLVFWRAFVLTGMIFWGLMTQIWILSYINIIIIIIIIIGKVKTVIAKIYINANHVSNTTVCSFT